MQPHLGKCFDGIRRLEFGGDDPKSPDILAMVSAEGEKVPLGKNLKVSSFIKAVAGAFLGSTQLYMRNIGKRICWQCQS